MSRVGSASIAFENTVSESSKEVKNLTKNSGNSAISLDGLGAKLVGAKLKAVAMTAAQTALNAAMSMGLSVIVELAVSGLTMLIDNLIHADEKLLESAEAGNEAFQSISETAGGYRELKGSLESIAPRYIELSQGVGVLGANISLTDIEYAEFLSLSSELAALFPELVTGYDSNGNAMLNLSGDVETLSAAFGDLFPCVSAGRNVPPKMHMQSTGIIIPMSFIIQEICQK